MLYWGTQGAPPLTDALLGDPENPTLTDTLLGDPGNPTLTDALFSVDGFKGWYCHQL